VRDELSHLLAKGLKNLGLTADEASLSKLVDYGLLLKKANKAIRLVSQTEPMDLAYHILDSAAALRLALPDGSILDVGSGGGLPGIPLAILEPQRNFCLLESRQRRATFLEYACLSLELDNVRIQCARFEDIDFQDMNIAISRALAAPDTFLEMLQSFQGTHAVIMTNDRVFPVKDRGPWRVLGKDTPPIKATPRHLNVLFEKD
jgi:16S rRNA (guanine527-N7)-methyltransferase